MQKEKTMRNFKKILIAACVLALLVAGCAVFAFADDGAPAVGTVEELIDLIEIAEGNFEKPDDKYSAVLDIAEYIDTHELDTSSYAYSTAIIRINSVTVECARVYIDAVYAEGVDDSTALDCISKASEILNLFELPKDTYGLEEAKNKYNEALVQTANIFMQGIDADIETSLKTASNQVAINKMNKLMSDCSFFGEDNPLTAVEARFAELKAAHERAVAKNLEKLDAMNAASNYDLPQFYKQDWEKVSVSSSMSVTHWSVDTKGISNFLGVQQEKNGNKYFVHRYLEQENPQGTYAQLSMKGAGVIDAQQNGVVIEFDITTFSEVPAQGVYIETGSIRAGAHPPHYFYLNGNGDICDDKGNPVVPGAIVKGQWLHVIVALEPTTFVYNIYVAGEHVATYDAKYNGNERFEHGSVGFRISGSGSNKNGEVCFDNIFIYSGNGYRNHNRLENMTDNEKLAFYVEFFSNDNNEVLARKDAYYKAAALVKKYWIIDETTGEGSYAEGVAEDEALKKSVDTFNAFDVETIINAAKSKNLARYIELVSKLTAIERKVDTVQERNAAAAEVSDFLKNNDGMIDIMSDTDENGISDYEEYYEQYNRVLKQADYDANSVLFVRYVQRFEGASSLSAMQRYYNRAKLLVDDGKIDLEIILDESTPDRENFTDLINAYKTFTQANKKVDDATKTARSEKIVLAMSKINGYRTTEEWEANRDEVLLYIGIVKEYIIYTDKDGGLLYDDDYDGIKPAISFFDDVYGYFFVQIQNEHVEYIADILERISATDSYVSKMGLVSLAERYIDTNEIDFADARIIALINNIDTCKSELQLRREDYAKVLVENANYFVSYVENMRTAKTYQEQKAYYEKAALYYFSIDITVEGARRAVEIFDEYRVILERKEESTVKFIEAVAMYKASETADDKYAALVECYYHAQYAELSYDGVAEAMAEYQAAYDEYMGYVTAVNKDVQMVGGAVGSVRTNMGITTIIAIVIKKLFDV